MISQGLGPYVACSLWLGRPVSEGWEGLCFGSNACRLWSGVPQGHVVAYSPSQGRGFHLSRLSRAPSGRLSTCSWLPIPACSSAGGLQRDNQHLLLACVNPPKFNEEFGVLGSAYSLLGQYYAFLRVRRIPNRKLN